MDSLSSDSPSVPQPSAPVSGRSARRIPSKGPTSCIPKHMLSLSSQSIATARGYNPSVPTFSVCPESSRTERPLRKRRRPTATAVSTALCSAIGFLESEFKERKAASVEFPPLISAYVLRSSTSSRTLVCASCRELVRTTDIHTIKSDDPRLHIIGEDNLDSCGHEGTSWYFCQLCFSAVSRSKGPKFSAANGVNITMCQSYPSILFLIDYPAHIL
ncbi:hypothetical protein V8E54_014751 [Elaphomyces granulatus]